MYWPGEAGGGEAAQHAAAHVDSVPRQPRHRHLAQQRAPRYGWHREHGVVSDYGLKRRYIVFLTHDIEDLGGGDGVKVGELVADLAPEDAARVHGDGIELNPGRAATGLLKEELMEYLCPERKCIY